MPLNNAYDEQAVIQAIASALETFYGTLIEKIDGLNIQKVMKRKNPYLYRAKAMQSATEIVDSVLTAFVSSSEETIFGNCFFAPIAIAASGGNTALAEGIDIMIQNNETNTISAIAVKSGPSVFNADSKKRQEQNFTAASKLAQQAKARYEAYIGYCYGKKKESGKMEKERFLSLKGNHSCGSAFYHAVSHLLAGKNIHQPDGGYPERNGISDKKRDIFTLQTAFRGKGI